jgi:hypothetical protein
MGQGESQVARFGMVWHGFLVRHAPPWATAGKMSLSKWLVLAGVGVFFALFSANDDPSPTVRFGSSMSQR